MQTEIRVKVSRQSFRFSGKSPKQNENFEIEMGQFDASEAINYQANGENMKSQCGCVLGFTLPTLEACSGSRSKLAAEQKFSERS